MALAFSPACRPLLRGGLPHMNTQAAAALVLAYTPEMSVWPYLPQRGLASTALGLAAHGFPGLHIDRDRERLSVDPAVAERAVDRLGLAYLRGEGGSASEPAEAAASLNELLRQIGATQRRPRLLVGELLGPISMSLLLSDNEERPLAYEPALREAVLQHVALRINWQHRQLAEHAEHIIICLDEPFLGALGQPFCPIDWEDGAELIDRIAAGKPAHLGICTSGAVNWAAVLAAPIDLVVFDAYNYSPALLQGAATLAGFIDRGGCLGWGIVPADAALIGHEPAALLAQRLSRAIEYLAVASTISVERLLAVSLITTSSGLDLLSVAQAERAAQLCREVSQLIREQYHLS